MPDMYRTAPPTAAELATVRRMLATVDDVTGPLLVSDRTDPRSRVVRRAAAEELADRGEAIIRARQPAGRSGRRRPVGYTTLAPVRPDHRVSAGKARHRVDIRSETHDA